MPRKHNTVHWHITLPADVANRVDLTLLDSVTGRVKYGARQKLAERLFRRYLEEEFPDAKKEA